MDNKPVYVCGLDLGQQTDYTALCVMERSLLPDGRRSYACRHLERYPLRTPYPEVGRQLKELTGQLPSPTVAVDQTGVGMAVMDILRGLQLPAYLAPIIITAGFQVSRDERGSHHVPKKELVGVVQSLLQSGRLQFAARLKLAKVCQRELEAFRAKMNIATGNESFEAWRERDHDDLVLSVALACWAGENAYCGPKDYRTKPPGQGRLDAVTPNLPSTCLTAC
jgi:hypothetical protein